MNRLFPLLSKLSRVSIFLLSALAILILSNFIFNYIPGILQIIGYALLIITICCCYEAYFKIRRNSGYIYIALICFLILLPGAINVISSILSTRPARMESVVQRTSSVSQCEIKNSVEIEIMEFHLPLMELFLLLAVLKFSISDEQDKIEKDAPDKHISMDA